MKPKKKTIQKTVKKKNLTHPKNVIKPKHKILEFRDSMSVGELAKIIDIGVVKLKTELKKQGIIVKNAKNILDRETCILITEYLGFKVKEEIKPEEKIRKIKKEKVEKKEEKVEEKKEIEIPGLIRRPPVVTVMGHVDHGKTTLLDAIRHSNVIQQEAGGITQHIGAYKVKTEKGEIVFIDTPGHEAFTAMRARGSKITDIVILVIAADDGIMPQTIEAINHVKSANVPVIVAINKIDLPNVNVYKIKQNLVNYGLVAEEFGGDTFFVEISAKNKINIDKLLDTILFKAELMELKSTKEGLGEGVVIESKLDSKKGHVATVLITKGILKVGDIFICGNTYGKVRAIIDTSGKKLQEVIPVEPVEIMGFNTTPIAGDKFSVVKNETDVKEIIEKKLEELKTKKQTKKTISLQELVSQKSKKLNIILKTDVYGSLEAITDLLKKLIIGDIEINIVHSGVGPVNLSDVNLAILSKAIIIGFNIIIDPNAEELIKKESVNVKTYRIIYELIDDIKKFMSGLIQPEYKQIVTGRAIVKKVFHVSNVGTVAGCIVENGVIQRNLKTRLIRDNVIVYDKRIASLRSFKTDVKEVKKGCECGILLENFSDIKPGDILETYILEQVK